MKGSTTRLSCNIISAISSGTFTLFMSQECDNAFKLSLDILISTKAIRFYPFENSCYRGGATVTQATEMVLIIVSNIWNFIMYLQQTYNNFNNP